MTSADAGTRRCPSCGARMAPSQRWCALCWADPRPEPAITTASEPASVTATTAAPQPPAAVAASAPGAVAAPLPTRRSIHRAAATGPTPPPPTPSPSEPASLPVDLPRWAAAADALRTPAGRVVAGLVGVVAASATGTAVLGLLGSFL